MVDARPSSTSSLSRCSVFQLSCSTFSGRMQGFRSRGDYTCHTGFNRDFDLVIPQWFKFTCSLWGFTPLKSFVKVVKPLINGVEVNPVIRYNNSVENITV